MAVNRPDIGEVRKRVERNTSIVDTTSLRSAFLARAEIAEITTEAGSPADFVRAHRAKTLSPFRGFFTEVTPRISKLSQSKSATLKVTGLDNLFTKPNDSIDRTLRGIFTDLELRDRWMSQIDERVSNVSAKNLEMIDIAKSKGQTIKKDLVIVGGGPLTALAATVLGPYFNITVITEQESVGEPWRSRPLAINSSSEDTFRDPRLPLLKGSTTPITPFGFANALTTTDLLRLDPDTVRVRCRDKSTRQYVSGIAFGEVIATNIVSNVSDFIVGQTVDSSRVKVNADGSKKLTLLAEDGQKRTIDAGAVLFLTGPGKETSKIRDLTTRQEYKKAEAELDKTLRRFKQTTRSIRKRIGDPTEVAKRLAEIKIPLPRYLSLTAVEKILGFWQRELGKSPEAYPFADLLKADARVAIVGNGDTGRTLAEFLQGRGPSRAYPKGYDRKSARPQITLYNEGAQTSAEYDETARVRYGKGRVFGRSVTTNPFKAERIVVEPDGKEARVRDEIFRSQTFDYVFEATGFEEVRLDQELRRSTGVSIGPISEVVVQGGNIEQLPLALGNEGYGIYIGGTATNFALGDFPREINEIIRALGIRENTKALWAFEPITERLLWKIGRLLPINKEGLQKTVEFGRVQRVIEGRRSRDRLS